MAQKVLIVEDEPAIADTIQYALETDGFETMRLTSGLPALAVLEAEHIDIVVLDVGLPDINGFELCKEIRKTTSVPIIFLTARSDEIDKVVGLEIGADDYVTKPFSPRELSARVKALIRRTRVPAGSSNHSMSFSIDESRKQIIYFGKNLDLSRYEFAILKTFIQRPGHVYSRDQLMNICWDEPESSMDRTIDAHIKNLRNKLKAVKPDLDPIVTHRGMGYSLDEGL
ncbi:MAG: two-component system response regulator CreB [Desulfobacteraceae bacterium]|jgi:two-component system catabolic regulation response regulator CreB